MSMSTPSTFRTDRNNNPTAFTTDIAKEAGLVLGKDYEQGDSFQAVLMPDAPYLYTAKLLGDPVALTIQVIDKLGFYTKAGSQRWSYIALPSWIWDLISKTDVIGAMYKYEGGTAMVGLFPNFEKLSIF